MTDQTQPLSEPVAPESAGDAAERERRRADLQARAAERRLQLKKEWLAAAVADNVIKDPPGDLASPQRQGDIG
jgi:hypothetical protein